MQVSLTFFTALLLNSYWMIQLPALYAFVRTSKATFSRMTRPEVYKGVAVGMIGVLDSAGRALALNALPGSLFVIFASSDMAFNYLLSRFVLKKQFTW